MTTTLAYLFLCAAGVSFLYALIAMMRSKGGGRDKGVDQALRRLSSHQRRAQRVKESSRLLKPDPAMRKATEGEDAVIEPPPLEAPPEEDVQEAEEAAPEVEATPDMDEDTGPPIGAQGFNFLDGLSDDIKSDYRERQGLTSENPEDSQADGEEHADDGQAAYGYSQPSDTAALDENVEPAYDAAYAGDEEPAEMLGVRPSTSQADEFEDVSNADDTGTDGDETDEGAPNIGAALDQVFGGFDDEEPQEEEIPPTPQDVSTAFRNLQQKADTERGENGTDGDSENDERGDSDDDEQTLFK